MEKLAEELASLLSDYRKSEKLNPKKENVLKWINQFSEENRITILEEMVHIFKNRYLTEKEVDNFLLGLVTNEHLTKNDPNFWRDISLLEIQQNGHSQAIMNEKFKKIIKDGTGVHVVINDNSKNHFIHIDDFLFTGNRLKMDLTDWIQNHAPKNANLDIIYIGYYKNGQYHVKEELNKINSKNIKINYWRLYEFENNPNCQNASEVLWPTDDIKIESNIMQYLLLQGVNSILRDKTQKPSPKCQKSFFTSEKNRLILEKEFTLAGLKINNSIHEESKKKHWKPLGIHSYRGLGFGALVFSYRNCPNNTPLAFWWGDWDNNQVWYPLLKRIVYEKKVAPIETDGEGIEWI